MKLEVLHIFGEGIHIIFMVRFHLAVMFISIISFLFLFSLKQDWQFTSNKALQFADKNESNTYLRRDIF